MVEPMFKFISEYLEKRKKLRLIQRNNEGYCYAQSEYENDPTQQTIDKLTNESGSSYPSDSDEDRQFDCGIYRYLSENNLRSTYDQY